MHEKKTRRLAAVMFADIVGYAAMMQTNEQDAVVKGKRHKKTLEHLVTNTGDIVYDGESIYGDGVNVASRIESLAVPGSILVSGKVYDEIKNHPEFNTVSLGEFKLKNIQRPVRLFALANQGLAVPGKNDLQPNKKTAGKAIAVLPFINLSPDPENEYFSDGISEEIICVLTRIKGLEVTARTSSFAFKGKNVDIREIGQKLGVSTILEGSVRKAGNRVRITAQLVNTEDGFHIFSEDYDRDLKDIFALQDEIAMLITNKMRENFVSPSQGIVREAPPTDNLNAYEMYLKGRHSIVKGSFEGAMESLSFFKKAIYMDPGYALAYSGLSFAYLFIGASRYSDQEDSYAKAKMYAEKARELDDSLADTHLALARMRLFNDWDLKGANRSIAKALRLGPGSAEIHGTHALILLAENKLEEARKEANIAAHSDPFSLFSNFVLGSIYYSSGQYAEAVMQLDRAIEKIPTFQQAHVVKTKALLCAGETEKAIAALDNIPESPNRLTLQYAFRAIIHAQKGERKKVLDYLEKIKAQEKAGIAEFLHWSYALVYMALNDTDKMFEHLEKSRLEKTYPVLLLRVDTLFKPFRDDPRFVDLIGRVFNEEQS
jgi:TolB-like protein/Tfp pilus assembly protein PilF